MRVGGQLHAPAVVRLYTCYISETTGRIYIKFGTVGIKFNLHENCNVCEYPSYITQFKLGHNFRFEILITFLL
jgi:hypothetical protein